MADFESTPILLNSLCESTVVYHEVDVESKKCENFYNKILQIDRKARNKLLIALVICFLFMIGEVIGGVLANSLAIMTDAAHLITDVISFLISLLAIYLSTRPVSKNFSFGWARAEVIGALMSVLFIWIITGILVFLAIERIRTGDYDISPIPMLITSAIGVAANVIMCIVLQGHGHGHGHSHGPSHGHSHNQSRKKENINVRAAFIHVVGDFLQSVGVLIAAFIIYFTDWKLADPICTFIFSVLILFTTLAVLRDTLKILMQATPKELSLDKIKSSLYKIDGVLDIHGLRLWSLTLNHSIFTVHIIIKPAADFENVLNNVTHLMNTKFKLDDVTIQLEKQSSITVL